MNCSHFEYDYSSQVCSLLSGNLTESSVKSKSKVTGSKNCKPFYMKSTIKIMVNKQVKDAFNTCSFVAPPKINEIMYRCKDLYIYSAAKISAQKHTINQFKQYLKIRANTSKIFRATKFNNILNSLEKIPVLLRSKYPIFQFISDNQEKIKKTILDIIKKVSFSPAAKHFSRLVSTKIDTKNHSIKQVFEIRKDCIKENNETITFSPKPRIEQSLWDEFIQYVYNHDGLQYSLIFAIICIQSIFWCIHVSCKKKDLDSTSYTDLKTDLEDPHSTPEFLKSIQFSGP